MTKLTDNLYKEIDNGNLTGMVFIDFKKAFDLVNHNVLLEKLKIYQFDKHTINWFTSYLSNRSQKVQIGTSISKSEIISAGVPQGSILGPLVFLLFINDLPLILNHTKSDLFADDLSLSISAPNKTDIQIKYANPFKQNSFIRKNSKLSTLRK